MNDLYQNQDLADLLFSHVKSYIHVDDEALVGVPSVYVNRMFLDPNMLLENVFIPQWSAWLKAAAKSYNSMSDSIFRRVMLNASTATIKKNELLSLKDFSSGKAAGVLLGNYVIEVGRILSNRDLSVYGSDDHRDAIRYFFLKLSEVFSVRLENEFDGLFIPEDKWLQVFQGDWIASRWGSTLDEFIHSLRQIVNALSEIAVADIHDSNGAGAWVDQILTTHFRYVEEFKKLGVGV